jgi:hypothetical protein
MKTIIHVDRSIIALNYRDNGNRPVYVVKTENTISYARKVKINGPCEMVYDDDKRNFGAKAYIVTESEVELIDEMTYEEAVLSK